MSKKPYGPAVFNVNGIKCQVGESGVIIFFHGNFRRVFNPKLYTYEKEILGRIRPDMLSYGIDGRTVSRIIDLGYSHSLKIRGL